MYTTFYLLLGGKQRKQPQKPLGVQMMVGREERLKIQGLSKRKDFTTLTLIRLSCCAAPQ